MLIRRRIFTEKIFYLYNNYALSFKNRFSERKKMNRKLFLLRHAIILKRMKYASIEGKMLTYFHIENRMIFKR